MLKGSFKKTFKGKGSRSKKTKKSTMITNLKSQLTSIQNSRNNTSNSIIYKKGSIRFQENTKEDTGKENKSQNIILNRQLIKKTSKPNRFNFLQKISYIYDLLLAKIRLPQFIQYFLGDALYKVRKSSTQTSKVSDFDSFDWKLDNFKKQCELVYLNSEEEDLKFFMSMNLPSLNRWGNHSFSKIETKPQTKERSFLFKTLTRKPIHSESQENQALQRLNRKLDSYLQKTYNIQKIRQ